MAVEPKRETRRRQGLLYHYAAAEEILASEKTYGPDVHKRIARRLKKHGYVEGEHQNFGAFLEWLRRSALGIKP